MIIEIDKFTSSQFLKKLKRMNSYNGNVADSKIDIMIKYIPVILKNTKCFTSDYCEDKKILTIITKKSVISKIPKNYLAIATLGIKGFIKFETEKMKDDVPKIALDTFGNLFEKMCKQSVCEYGTFIKTKSNIVVKFENEFSKEKIRFKDSK